MVWPIYSKLNQYLVESQSDAQMVKMMKRAGKEYIESHFSDFEPTMEHKTATVLHPLLRKKNEFILILMNRLTSLLLQNVWNQ